MVMQVANTRESLILALKNDKNSECWEEFVNQYSDAFALLKESRFAKPDVGVPIVLRR